GDILILMGATQGIDVGVKFEIYALVTELTRRGAAVVFVSAEMPEILGLSHRILVMHRGRLAATLDGPSATAEQVLRHALGQKADMPSPPSPRAQGEGQEPRKSASP